MEGAMRADQFERYLAAVLNDGTSLASVPAEFRSEVELACRLAGTDFSMESRRHGRPAPASARRWAALAPRRPVAAAFLLALLAALLVASPLSTSLARDAVRVMGRWLIGQHTRVRTVDGDFSVTRGADGRAVIAAPPEIRPIEEATGAAGAEHSLDFAAAQAATDFRLKMPLELPEGYAFQGVVVSSPTEAQLEFLKLPPGAGLIGLLERRAGPGDDESAVVATADVEVVSLTVDGRPALWMDAGEEGLLVWEAGGVSYQLAGLSDAEAALQVARSLR